MIRLDLSKQPYPKQGRGHLSDFYLLGTYASIKHEDVKQFHQLTHEHFPEFGDGRRFLSHSLFLSGIIDEAVEVEGEFGSFFCEEHGRNNFILINAFKMNMCASYVLGEESTSAKVLFSKTKKLINETCSYEHPSRKNLKWNVYACMGSYDVVLVCSSPKLSSLLELSYASYNIEFDDGMSCFSSVVSLLAVHKNIDVELCRDNYCTAKISLSLNLSGVKLAESLDPESTKSKLAAIIEAALATPEFKIGDVCDGVELYLSSSGRRYELFIKNCRVDRLLSLYGIGCIAFASDKERCGAPLCVEGADNWYAKHVLDMHSKFYTPHMAGVMPLKNTEGKAHDNTFETNLISEINGIKKRVESLIPLSIRHTLNVLIELFPRLLVSETNRVIGMKVSVILREMLKTIECNRPNAIPERAIEESILSIAHILNIPVQTNNVFIDHIDSDDFDVFERTMKLAYAYEYALYSVFRILNRGDDVVLFLMVGYKPDVKATKFFSSEGAVVQGCKTLVSINLPDYTFFNPSIIAPYLYHEVGHYTRLHEERGHANRAYSFFIRKFIIKFIGDIYESKLKKFERRDDTARVLSTPALKEMNKDLEKIYRDYKADKTATFKAYVAAWGARLRYCHEYFRKNLDKVENIYTNISPDFFYDSSLVDLFRELYESNFPARHYETFREARADIIMVAICKLDAVAYINIMEQRLEDGAIKTSASDDTDVAYRMAFVLLALYLTKNVEVLESSISNYIHEIRVRINADCKTGIALEILRDEWVLIKEVAEYLKSEHEIVNVRLEEAEEAPFIIDASEIRKYNIDTAMDKFLEQWYKGIQNWKNIAFDGGR